MRVIIISLFATLACAGIIKAATTIGTNISTGGTLDVTGVSTLTGNTNIAGSLTSSGANTFYGATSIGGALTATSTLAVNGATTLHGALTGYGNTTLSNLIATGTLSVTGLTTLGNASTTQLSVSSNAYLATTTIIGNLTFSAGNKINIGYTLGTPTASIVALQGSPREDGDTANENHAIVGVTRYSGTDYGVKGGMFVGERKATSGTTANLSTSGLSAWGYEYSTVNNTAWNGIEGIYAGGILSTEGVDANSDVTVTNMQGVLSLNFVNDFLATNADQIVTNAAGFRAVNTSLIRSGTGIVRVNNQYGFLADDWPDSGSVSGGASVTSYAGFTAVQPSNYTPANTTLALLGTKTIPSGNYAIYNSSTYGNLISGHVAIGSAITSVSSLELLKVAEVMTNNSSITGINLQPTHSPTSSGNYTTVGLNGTLNFTSNNWGANAELQGMFFSTVPKGDTLAGSTTVEIFGTKIYGVREWGTTGGVNNGGFQAENIYGSYIKPYLESGAPDPATAVTGNLYGQYIANSSSLDTITTNAGIWIEALSQSAATNNYGIVLDGSGAGADILLGETQDTRIYQTSDADETLVLDAATAGSGVVKLNNILNIVPQATAPASPASGDIYVDSTPNPDELCFYDGSAWQGISSGTDANCQ